MNKGIIGKIGLGNNNSGDSSGGSTGPSPSLPYVWVADNSAIRALTTHEQGADIAAYDTLKWFEFNSTSTAADDDSLVLKPNDISVGDPGRWIFKVQLSIQYHVHNLSQIFPDSGNGKKLIVVDETGAILGYSSFTYDQIIQLNDVDLSDINVGESKILLAEKGGDGNPIFGGAISQLDKLGPPALSTLLSETAAWDGDEITITGNNLLGALGENSQEYYIGSDFFLCISHSLGTDATNGTATWRRNRGQDALTPGLTNDDAIISELETETGWSVANFKTITSKSKQGTWYRNVTGGYLFMCVDKLNGWTRVGTPSTTDLEITSASHPTLTTNLAAYDFATNGLYDESSDGSNEAAEQGQEWWDETNDAVYKRNMNGKWAKIFG